jgi:predicted DNA-binding ribbon-helix-helix protein
MNSQFLRRNVTIDGRRTSLRLESAIWHGLEEICRRERIDFQQICNLIEQNRDRASRTSALRIFIVNYFRIAANLDSFCLSDGIPPGYQNNLGGMNIPSILELSTLRPAAGGTQLPV